MSKPYTRSTGGLPGTACVTTHSRRASRVVTASDTPLDTSEGFMGLERRKRRAGGR